MVDASVDLEDLGAADATLEHLVQAAARACDAGRLGPGVVPLDVAARSWAPAHGVVSLVAGGPLSLGSLDHVSALLRALLVAEGDDLDRARERHQRSHDAQEQGENGGAQAARQPLWVGQRAGIGAGEDVLAARGAAWSPLRITPPGVRGRTACTTATRGVSGMGSDRQPA